MQKEPTKKKLKEINGETRKKLLCQTRQCTILSNMEKGG